MPKFPTSAALAVIIMTVAPAAFAQTTPSQPQTGRSTASDRSQPSTFTTQSGKLRASEIIGSTVYDRQNENIGSVKDVLLDGDNKVNSVVVDVGAFLGMGGKYVAVSLSDFKTDNNRLTLDKTKQQLQSAPEFHFSPAR